MAAAGRERGWWMLPFWVVLIGSLSPSSSSRVLT